LIESVNSFSDDGFIVKYANGDICDSDPDGSNPVFYSSEIKYLCNNMTDELGWPDFIGTKGKCHYIF
jgi:hypothetical protein